MTRQQKKSKRKTRYNTIPEAKAAKDQDKADQDKVQHYTQAKEFVL